MGSVWVIDTGQRGVLERSTGCLTELHTREGERKKVESRYVLNNNGKVQ